MFEAPTPADPGFEVLDDLTSREGGVRIESWSPELEKLLASTAVIRIVLDDAFRDVHQLLPYASGVRVFVAGENALPLISSLHHLEDLHYSGSLKGVDFGSLPRLRTCILSSPDGHLGNLGRAVNLEDAGLFGPKTRDLAELGALSKLRRVYINQPRGLASLDGLRGLRLEELEIVQPRSLTSIGATAESTTLRSFQLHGGRKVTDLERIGDLPTLEKLHIWSGPALNSFGFLQDLRKLQDLSIFDTDVGATANPVSHLVRLSELRVLRLSAGLKIAADFARLGEITSLRVLSFDRGPALPSLDFLRGLIHLEELQIGRTPVADGDMRVLLELPNLRRLNELSPVLKHYTHRPPQINAALRARHPEFWARADAEEAAAKERTDRMLAGLTSGATAFPAAEESPAAAVGTAGEQARLYSGPVLLGDVHWRFDQRISSAHEMVRRIAEEGESTWDPGEIVIGGKRIRLLVPELGEEAAPIEIWAERSGFTAAELLFKLHVALAPDLAASDHRYFEGVSPAGLGEDDVPRFTVLLGS